MPFTPFHLGPGALFKAVGGRHFSFMVFGGTQVLMDIEPLLGLIRGWPVLHGYTHTLAGALLNPETRHAFVGRTRDEYAEVRRAHENRETTQRRLTLADARANRLKVDWDGVVPPRPTFTGVQAIRDFPLERLVERIDWSPFFHTWELAGRYPEILSDPVVGNAASSLFADALGLLARSFVALAGVDPATIVRRTAISRSTSSAVL